MAPSTHLVTGGAGFIGSHLVAALAARGERVRVLDDLSSGRRENLASLDVGPVGSGAQVELLEGSIGDAAAVERAVEGCHAVLHQAAQVSVPQSVARPVESLDVNVLGTARLLECARRAGVRRLVFAASSAAYGASESLPKCESDTPQPLSPYAVGKLAGEQLLEVYGRMHGITTVSLRYFNVFGPRQRDDSPYTGVIALFARALLSGRQVTIHGDGEQTRDFTFVENAVQANLLALEVDVPPGSVFNVGAGERISVNQLYDELALLAGVTAPALHGPDRPGDVRHSLASLDKIERLLGYRPLVDWRTGLAATFSWYRSLAAAQGAKLNAG